MTRPRPNSQSYVRRAVLVALLWEAWRHDGLAFTDVHTYSQSDRMTHQEAHRLQDTALHAVAKAPSAAQSASPPAASASRPRKSVRPAHPIPRKPATAPSSTSPSADLPAAPGRSAAPLPLATPPTHSETPQAGTTPSAPLTQESSQDGTTLDSSLLTRNGFGAIVRADYFSASKRLNQQTNLIGLTVQPKWEQSFGTLVDVKVEGRLHDEGLGKPGGQQHRLLEGYGTVHLGKVDLRLGQQIVNWGRADALNPTDVLTPKDYTHLSAEAETDRRFGLPSASLALPLGDTLVFSAIWLPVFQSSVVPIPGQLPFQLVRQWPSSAVGNHSIGLKLDRSGTGVDWSVSYFQGFDLIPFGRVASPTTVLLRNQRIRMVGADLATTVGRYGLRVETAYIRTDDPYGRDPEARNPSWTTVAGVDRDLTDSLNLSVQTYLRHIFAFEDTFRVAHPLVQTVSVLNATIGNQLDRWQTGAMVRLKGSWFQQTLDGELVAIWNANRGDAMIRPSLAHAFTDSVKVYVGADLFTGRRDSFYGRLQDATAVFVEVRATY